MFFITSQLPVTFETTHGFSMYIASSKAIGKPSHLDGSRKTSPETLTLDELINERGREFAWEGWRRQDLVRWDKFAKGRWTFKEALNNNSRDLFPIPYDQITKNQSWKQNPGY